MSSFVPVTAGSDSALAMAIAQQPTFVSIDAGSAAFQNYGGGVFSDAAWCVSAPPAPCESLQPRSLSIACSGSSINHAPVAVGYGNDPNFGPYWLLKNSASADSSEESQTWL